MGGPEVRDDRGRPQLGAELDRVLYGGATLHGSILVLNGEDGEIRGVNRQLDTQSGGCFTELCASALLPREPFDERQLERGIPAGDDRFEKSLVIPGFVGLRRSAVAKHRPAAYPRPPIRQAGRFSLAGRALAT
jgi:hypothetical protein